MDDAVFVLEGFDLGFEVFDGGIDFGEFFLEEGFLFEGFVAAKCCEAFGEEAHDFIDDFFCEGGVGVGVGDDEEVGFGVEFCGEVFLDGCADIGDEGWLFVFLWWSAGFVSLGEVEFGIQGVEGGVAGREDFREGAVGVA